MNCLCCGKKIDVSEEINGWHNKCIIGFFETNTLPDIEISEEIINDLAIETTSMGYTIPGVQKKLSLHLLSEDSNPRLTLVNYPAGYILKPQVAEYPHLPESEHLIMSMANVAGIPTVPHALIRNSNDFSYITKRIDRIVNNQDTYKLAMEDFCQLDNRLTEDKYKGSYERCAKVITRYSSRPGLDMTELFIRLVFCFIIGNSDMHMKNFSLIEKSYMSNEYILSPAYDLLPVNIIIPSDKDEFAIPMNGKKRNLRRKDFLEFAEFCHITNKSAEKMIDKILKLSSRFILMCNESLLPSDLRENLINLIENRVSKLS